MFAAMIERGRVARADGYLRKARPEVQRITPPPICVVELAEIPILFRAGADEIMMGPPCFV